MDRNHHPYPIVRLNVEHLEPRETPTADLMPINDFVVPIGKDLLVPVSLVSQPNTEVDYSVGSSNPGVTASMVTRQRSLQLDVTGTDSTGSPFSGRLTLALFEDDAPLASARIITLTERPDGPGSQGNYDGTIFHRIIDGFVIQGGDMQFGNGTGGSDLGTFPDEIRPNLTFNSPGLLAMANAGPGTNNSQFFITDIDVPPLQQPQHLNGRHTIFGILTGGFDTFQKIITTPTGTNNRPLSPVTIVDASIVNDLTRGVVRISPSANFSGSSTITVSAEDGSGPSMRNFSVVYPGPNQGTPVNQNEVATFAVAGGVGGTGQIRVLDGDGSVRFESSPFTSAPGGIRVATADINADGIPDLIAGTGPGVASQVFVIDGQTRSFLRSLEAFEPSFLGGVYVAAGDINGDGIPDIAISPDLGGGPRVRIYDGATGALIADDFFIKDPNFFGGVRVALADINGDGRTEVLVAAGFGGGPRVSIYRGEAIAQGDTSEAAKLVPDFFTFEPELRNGVFIAGGDINANGFSELIVGGGPGGGPRVFILDGLSLAQGQLVQAGNFFAGDLNNRGGVPVVTKRLTGDGRADLVTGAGTDATPVVRIFEGASITPEGQPTEVASFLAADVNFLGGINVG